jgi:thiamine kinase-like enzyme
MSIQQPFSYYQQLVQNLIGRAIIDMELIYGGRNSRAYKAVCTDAVYAFKIYIKNETDKRDRLNTEFSSLHFLEACGLTNVPRAVIADPEHNCAVYEFIDGSKVINSDIRDSDIDQAVTFLTKLEKIKSQVEGRNIQAASEACFSILAIWNNIDKRCSDLAGSVGNKEQYPELHDYFHGQFIPVRKKIEAWCCSKLKEAGIDPNEELELATRTLSPSDFGFHNALRRPDGELVFLDFEYFGWDDPAKMVVDMLHHPGMSLSLPQKRRFVKAILTHFRNYPQLRERVEIVYPLYGLKWCLILLNEFLPERLVLREFAGINTEDVRKLQNEQINKAKLLTEKLDRYDCFPYFN